MRKFGYARVSAADQNLDRQLQALTDYGLDPRDIIADKLSGKDFNRPGYLALKNQMLRSGDVLVIKELDRLGRSYEQMKTEWRELQALGVDIVVLDTPILNTKEKSNLEKALISNIIFELLSYTAEKERQKIKARQSEGIAAAKSKGKHLGRPQAIAPPGFASECAKWRNGEQSAVETMRRLGLKRTTFYKLTASITR
ncbi:DNA recombinase [Clostridia bacterium]|nr:DNA recombinase [Clostridia bacterium]